MNRSTLVIVTVVALALAFMTQQEAPKSSQRESKVFTFAPEKVSRITLTNPAGAEVRLQKDKGIWKVANLDSFDADPAKVSDLLSQSALLKFGDQVASGPQFLGQFELDFDGKDTKLKGTLIEFKDGEQELGSIVLGKERRTDRGMFGPSSDGQYMRLKSQDKIYLMKESFHPELIPSAWASKQLSPIMTSEIQSMVHLDEGVEKLSLKRLKPADPLLVQNLSAQEDHNPSARDTYQKALENFSVNGIEKATSEKVTASMTRVEELQISTFDGLQLILSLGKTPDAEGVRYGKSVWKTISATDSVVKKAEALNQKWQNYAFSLMAYQVNNLFKPRGELVSKKPISARHILIAYKDANGSKIERTKEQAKAVAEDLIKKLESGAKFEDLAKEHSNDDSNKDKGGDLGEFGSGRMVAPFEEAAFALKPDETTKTPVETQFGFHIIQRTK